MKLSLPELDTSTQRLDVTTPAGDCTLLYRQPDIMELDQDQWRGALSLQAVDQGAAQSSREAYRRLVIIGWEGVDDPHGNPIPFTHERLLSLMLHLPTVEAAVIRLTRDLFHLETIKGEPLPPPGNGVPGGMSATSGPQKSSDSPIEPAAPDSPSSSA